MNILDPVYTTNKLRYKVADIKQSLRRREDLQHLFVLVLNPASGCSLEYYSWKLLYRIDPENSGLTLAGFAEGKEKAKELVIEITQEALDKTGSADAAAYLAAKHTEEFKWF